MSTSHFESALYALPNFQEPEHLLKILNEIKKGLHEDRKGNTQKLYSTKNCLKALISLLEPDNDVDILNFTLSILGNLCLDMLCARDAMKKYHLIVHLVKILKRFQTDSILCRIFRIVGNSCQHDDGFANDFLNWIGSHEIITNIIECFKRVCNEDDDNTTEKPSKGTITMAIRSLRCLINSTTATNIIETYGIIKVVGLFLIKFTPHWKNHRKHQDILEQALNLIYTCSKYECFNMIHELRNIEEGNALLCIGDLILMSPVLVRKIIENLVKLCHQSSDLPINETVLCLLNKLEDVESFEKGMEDPMYTEYLHCLCSFVKNSTTCQVLNTNVVTALMNIMKNYETPTQTAVKNCKVILVTLQRLRYTSFLRFMLREGIINLLNEKLDWILGTKHNIDLHHSCERSPLPLHISKHSVYNGLTHEMECEFQLEFSKSLHTSKNTLLQQNESRKRMRSPSPSSSDGWLSSPLLSPASSSSSSDYDVCLSGDDTNSNYSPVYSDDECESLYDETDNADYKSASSAKKKSPESTFYMSTYALNNFSCELVNLIVIFTNMKPLAMELTSCNIIYKLLLFCLPKHESVRPQHILKIIRSVIRVPEHLLNLLKETNLVYAAHKFAIPKHNKSCLRCVDLFSIGRMVIINISKIVEGASGKGDIAHQLYRGNREIKRKLISSVPFIVEKGTTFNNLMLTCGGLKVMMELFQGNLDTKHMCVSGLMVMARKLKIKDPTTISEVVNGKENFMFFDTNQYTVKQNCESIVLFKLDDNSYVPADRSFLSENSDFFRTLLFGNFKESHEDEVRLHDVTNTSFKLLLMILESNLDNDSVIQIINIHLNVILETIALADRFLMLNLCGVLTTCIQYYRFSPKTVPEIYKWSVDSGTNILRVEIIAYAMVGSMSQSERYNIFDQILQLGYLEYLTDDIKQLLTRFLGIPLKNK